MTLGIKFWSAILGLAAVAAIDPGRAVAQEGRVIAVVGTAEIAAPPDTAWITLGVTTAAATAPDAVAEMSQAADGVLGAMVDFQDDILRMHTGQLSLTPVFAESGPDATAPRITGYRAETDVEVQLAGTGMVSEVVDAAMQAGATTLSGLRFGLIDPKPQRDAAQAAAVADALRQAAILSEAAGVALGPVLRVEARGDGGPGPVMMEMAASRSGVPVVPGDIATRSDVTVEIRLQDIE